MPPSMSWRPLISIASRYGLSGLSGLSTVPRIAAFCRGPIVWRSARVARDFWAAAAFATAVRLRGLRGSKPNWLSVWLVGPSVATR